MSSCPFPRLAGSFFLLFVALAVAAPGAYASLPRACEHTQAARSAGLSSLPAEAKASIAAALGRDQRAYHARAWSKGWRLENAKHGLRADFTAEGMELRKGAAHFGLQLTGLGRGARLEGVAPGTTQATANRVEHRRAGFTEWYVNGPLGLEQGFTLERRPPAHASGEALGLALQLSGAITAVPDSRGDGVALQTPQGRALLRYRGLAAWDAEGRMLPAWWQVAGSEVRLRVDDTGARYPLTIDPIFEDAKVTALDGAADDLFGRSVAVSGDTVVVGAVQDDIGAIENQGSAYVFVKPPGGWAGALHENAKLTASDGATFDLFGVSVAVSGDTVIVGAESQTSNQFQGSAYVFVKPPGGWAGALHENARLTASDGAARDLFGSSVAMSGDTVVVGAVIKNIGGNSGQGAAYVFLKPLGGWAGTVLETAELIASDGAVGDHFGGSVALSGDTVVVGAAADDIGGNSSQGSAYVFVKPAAGWAGLLTESAKLVASDGAREDFFGASVAVSGDTVVVGAPDHKIGPNFFQGLAYVFVEPNGGWVGDLTEDAKLTTSDGAAFDNFGISVAISGDTVYAGAIEFNGDQGAAYVIQKPTGGWAGTVRETAKLTASDGAAFDIFGTSVAVDGETVVVGADQDDDIDTDQGSAYVFEHVLPTPPPSVVPVANTSVPCRGTRCKVRLICPQDSAIACDNRIDLFVRASAARLSDDTAAKARRPIRFAFGLANVPPGAIANVRLRLTKKGKDIVKKKTKKRLTGVLEIRNAPGDLVSSTRIRIRLR